MADGEFLDLSLDLSRVDVSGFDAAIRRQEARGIAFTTLAAEQRREPAWLALFTDLENETRREIDPPRTVEQMVERIAFLRIDPEWLILARLGGRYAGYTYLNVLESEPGRLVQGWTGVRPELRRQGIATALKMLGILQARRHGFRTIVTSPRATNTASIRMSENVGFRPVSPPAAG